MAGRSDKSGPASSSKRAGVYDGLVGLADDAIVTVDGLASMLDRCRRTIQRWADNGQLPVPIRFGQESGWTVGVLRQHLAARQAEAARAAAVERQRLEKYGV